MFYHRFGDWSRPAPYCTQGNDNPFDFDGFLARICLSERSRASYPRGLWLARIRESLAPRRDLLSFTVAVGFDESEHRYYVISSDIPGLHIETETFEEFVDVAKDCAPDLVGDNAAGANIEFKRDVALA